MLDFDRPSLTSSKKNLQTFGLNIRMALTFTFPSQRKIILNKAENIFSKILENIWFARRCLKQK